MGWNKITITDIIKLLGACTCLLLGFLRKSENIGEDSESQYFQDYTHQQDTWSIQSEIDSWHFAAETVDFTNICSTYPSICKKITFIGDYASEEKANYLKNETDIINFLNTNNNIKPNFDPTIKTFKINNEEGERRWYATRDTVVLNTAGLQSDDEFNQLSCHELGHIFDLWFLQWTSKQKNTQYTEFKKSVFAKDDPSLLYYAISRQNESVRKTTAKKKDFCSWYGMSNPFEDFSECFNLYLNHNKVFKYIAQKNSILAKKYNFIATLLKWTYIHPSTRNIALVKSDITRRARDTTKIQAN